MTSSPDRHKVVITGLGAVTPLGIGAGTLHERWAAGECGIVDGAGACRDFDPTELLSVKEVRRLDRFAQFARRRSAEAIADAGWDGEAAVRPAAGRLRDRAPGSAASRRSRPSTTCCATAAPKMVSPLGIPQYMPNAAAAAVSMKHGLRGQIYGVVSACASGAHALGSACG